MAAGEEELCGGFKFACKSIELNKPCVVGRYFPKRSSTKTSG